MFSYSGLSEGADAAPAQRIRRLASIRAASAWRRSTQEHRPWSPRRSPRCPDRHPLSPGSGRARRVSGFALDHARCGIGCCATRTACGMVHRPGPRCSLPDVRDPARPDAPFAEFRQRRQSSTAIRCRRSRTSRWPARVGGLDLMHRLAKEYETGIRHHRATVAKASGRRAATGAAANPSAACCASALHRQPQVLEAMKRSPTVLVVAPCRATTRRCCATPCAACCTDHKVFITDWTDARAWCRPRGTVPPGRLRGYVQEFIRPSAREVPRDLGLPADRAGAGRRSR